jgi:hypothetical protein
MAYPIVPAPYGFKPVNLIGGQVFSGSTRNLPIQYGYATNIFYGDVVSITRGFVARLSVTTGVTSGYDPVGIFLGCSYTDPTTKQKRFSQYWPASTLAGDAVAIITDDPDTVFKVAAVTAQGGTTISSVPIAAIGLNIAGSDLAGNQNTGDSSNAVLATSIASTSTLPFRIIDVVRDTLVSLGTATLSSGGGSTSLVTSALPNALPIGTDVGFIASNGQYIGTGSYVSAAAAAGATAVTLNAQYGTINAGGSSSTGATIPATTNGVATTLVFTQYPEVLVKINFGISGYYNATGATTA